MTDFPNSVTDAQIKLREDMIGKRRGPRPWMWFLLSAPVGIILFLALRAI